MSTFIDFSDLDEDMSKPGAGQGVNTMTPQESVDYWREKGSISAQGAIYEEKCGDCHGTGKFRSYSGRIVGDCFTCKGAGIRKYKTSPEQRAKQREDAAKRSAKKLEAKNAATATWVEQHQAVVDFLRANTWSDYYRSLLQGLEQYGHLTVNQLDSAQRAMEKAAARDKQHAAQLEQAPTVVQLIEAFKRAREAGLKRPRLSFGEVSLSQAAPTSQNPGMIYVKYNDEYAGKITVQGKFIPIRNCPAQVAKLIAKLNEGDLLAKAKAYGLETGNCCCCGRLLTDPVSVANGIGPICEGRWFSMGGV